MKLRADGMARVSEAEAVVGPTALPESARLDPAHVKQRGQKIGGTVRCGPRNLLRLPHADSTARVSKDGSSVK